MGLAAWFGLGAVAAAYNAAVGPALVVGTAPVALWLGSRAGWRRCLIVFAGVALLAGLLLAVPAVRHTAVGYVGFVRDNQATNTTANDIPWADGAYHRDERTGVGSAQILWETVRFAWVGVALVAAALAWRAWAQQDRAGGAGPGLVPLAVGVVLVLLIVSPWTMGRIDAGATSRPGLISRTAVFLLLPPLLLMAAGPGVAATARAVVVSAVVVGLCYGSAVTSMDPSFVMVKAYSVRTAPAAGQVVDGASIGLPGLGQVDRPADGWVDQIAALRRDLDKVVRPGETFLDLTDEQALYYYMDLPCPVRYASYVAANGTVQSAELKQLADHPVPAVLVGPSPMLDGVPESLRCYRLYRQYVTRYVPVVSGRFTLLVDPARAAALPTTRPDAVPAVPPVTPTEARLRLLDEVFVPDQLRRLPIAWGRSWDALKPRFTVVAPAAVPASVSSLPLSVDVPVPPAVTDGSAADFVLLTMTCEAADPAAAKFAARSPAHPGSAEPDFTLGWTVDGDTQWSPGEVRFKGGTGHLLVPLGAYPRWLLARRPGVLRVAVANPRVLKSWRLDGVTFLRLSDDH